MLRNTLLTITLALTAVIAAAADANPKIAFPEARSSFGTIMQGQKIDHTFTFKNEGKRPLLIERVKTSCGCTVAEIPSRTIEPGKSGSIKTVFDSTNFAGPVSKLIYVYSNDPQLPVATLTLYGTISEQIVVSPRQINAGTVKKGYSNESVITIQNTDNKPITLKAVRTSAPQAKAVIVKDYAKPGDRAEIRVTITPASEDRMLSGYIIISTNHPVKGEITVPFYGAVAP